MENNLEYQKWLEVVENDGIDLYKVPEEFKTYEMCMVAIDSDSGAIDSVPLEHKTKELCETVLRYDGFQLINVPEALRTFEMCEIALENIDDERLELLCLETAVPKEFREELAEKYDIFPEELHELSNSEEELMQEYLQDVGESAYNFRTVPDKYKTMEMCEIAVDYHGQFLEFVPEIYKTKELCELAVTSDPDAFEFVPEKLRTFEMCLVSVEYRGNFLAYVPEEFKSQELCELAVEKNGTALEYVPDGLKTYELCELAVERSREWAMDYVPEEFQEELAEKYDVKLPDKAQSR